MTQAQTITLSHCPYVHSIALDAFGRQLFVVCQETHAHDVARQTSAIRAYKIQTHATATLPLIGDIVNNGKTLPQHIAIDPVLK